jgi:pilus assembly protein CpaB
MNPARIVVVIVAVGAGGLAAYLASSTNSVAPPPPPPQAQIETTNVLVAKTDIALGQSVSANDLQWQPWPVTSVAPGLIRKTERPDAIDQLSKAIARSPFATGEPIREAKLVKTNGSGFMAAILPSGMRAISTEVSAETGAGGFILPNDRVDVILTKKDRRVDNSNGTNALLEFQTTQTVLTNVPVLAIDQIVEEKNGQHSVVGKTATLELTPGQAETLALSRQQGTLSLALRSITDNNDSAPPPKPLIPTPLPATPPPPPKQEVENHKILLYRGVTRESLTCDTDCR